MCVCRSPDRPQVEDRRRREVADFRREVRKEGGIVADDGSRRVPSTGVRHLLAFILLVVVGATGVATGPTMMVTSSTAATTAFEWTQESLGVTPSAGMGAAMTFDPAIGKMV